MLSAVDDFENVRSILAEQRRQGATFPDAWQIALAALDRPTKRRADAETLDATLHALEATAWAWEAAYRREAPPKPAYRRSVAVARLRERLPAAVAA